jgi:hypothetical protein
MELRLKKTLAEAIGLPRFKPYGIDTDEWRWGDWKGLPLGELSAAKVEALRQLLLAHKAKRGAGVLVKDIETWQAALKDGAADQRPRSVRQFFDLVREYLRTVPKHWLYQRDENDGETWLAYYVNEVDYHPPVEHGDRRHPAYTTIDLVYKEFGGLYEDTISFYEQDVRAIGVVHALAQKGLYPEDEDKRRDHYASVQRWGDLQPHVGQQFLASGYGLLNVDGNPDHRNNSWYRRSVSSLELTRNGEPSRVVMDLFYEDRSNRPDSRVYVNEWFWKRRGEDPDADEAEGAVEPAEAEAESVDTIPLRAKVPLHPTVAVFDLGKHRRCRVHVNQLQEYVYDRTLADQLILGAERKRLVKLLIDSKSNPFQDIVKGKSGGAIVLLAGPPGTGKTLTAEVYAEAEGCALYSVQCSQLGIDPTDLEDELFKVFARAKRWGAVLLLDEADVYVHSRGNDLVQNAVVGVFLRVLEYQDAIMFLTTNRPDDVDDAIASRCVARLTYDVPLAEEQRQIWRVLATASGVTMTSEDIATVVRTHPHLSGRDVKNLLKLGRLMAPVITPEIVAFVEQFKPTT